MTAVGQSQLAEFPGVGQGPSVVVEHDFPESCGDAVWASVFDGACMDAAMGSAGAGTNPLSVACDCGFPRCVRGVLERGSRSDRAMRYLTVVEIDWRRSMTSTCIAVAWSTRHRTLVGHLFR